MFISGVTSGRRAVCHAIHQKKNRRGSEMAERTLSDLLSTIIGEHADYMARYKSRGTWKSFLVSTGIKFMIGIAEFFISKNILNANPLLKGTRLFGSIRYLIPKTSRGQTCFRFAAMPIKEIIHPDFPGLSSNHKSVLALLLSSIDVSSTIPTTIVTRSSASPPPLPVFGRNHACVGGASNEMKKQVVFGKLLKFIPTSVGLLRSLISTSFSKISDFQISFGNISSQVVDGALDHSFTNIIVPSSIKVHDPAKYVTKLARSGKLSAAMSVVRGEVCIPLSDENVDGAMSKFPVRSELFNASEVPTIRESVANGHLSSAWSVTSVNDNVALTITNSELIRILTQILQLVLIIYQSQKLLNGFTLKLIHKLVIWRRIILL